jgi:hypothetical protein
MITAVQIAVNCRTTFRKAILQEEVVTSRYLFGNAFQLVLVIDGMA